MQGTFPSGRSSLYGNNGSTRYGALSGICQNRISPSGQTADAWHLELMRLPGRGNVGEADLAQDCKPGWRAGVKLLPSTFANDNERHCGFETQAPAATLSRPNIVTRIAPQTASAPAASHAAGIVHRGLKPANLMPRPDGVAKVLDFGLARISVSDPARYGGSVTRTIEGRVLGTLTCIPPEQAGISIGEHRS